MGWQAPLYWEPKDSGWLLFTMTRLRQINPDTPVCHICYFEAEWENAARICHLSGNFLENEAFYPLPAQETGLTQIYGDVWEWTASTYKPCPSFKIATSAVGKYNGKCMSRQMILSGGSCVKPKSQIRRTYRNFFYPPDLWQLSGFRLAKNT